LPPCRPSRGIQGNHPDIRIDVEGGEDGLWLAVVQASRGADFLRRAGGQPFGHLSDVSIGKDRNAIGVVHVTHAGREVQIRAYPRKWVPQAVEKALGSGYRLAVSIALAAICWDVHLIFGR